MARYRIDVAYDGTNYAGWQLQPNGITIQEKLETALEAITGAASRVYGSGRTDAGVHARAQVAHFDLDWPRDRVGELEPALNAKLPPDIRVSELQSAADDFHAQYDVHRKEYRYHVWNGRVVPPFLRLYRAAYWNPLELSAMQDAARRLIGEHDFLAFSAYPNEEREGGTVRTIYEFDVFADGEDITFRVVGNGFLYKMVRSLSGWLIEVGRGRVTPEQTSTVLASAQRTEAVTTAPAKGLFLWEVTYPA